MAFHLTNFAFAHEIDHLEIRFSNLHLSFQPPLVSDDIEALISRFERLAISAPEDLESPILIASSQQLPENSTIEASTNLASSLNLPFDQLDTEIVSSDSDDDDEESDEDHQVYYLNHSHLSHSLPHQDDDSQTEVSLSDLLGSVECSDFEPLTPEQERLFAFSISTTTAWLRKRKRVETEEPYSEPITEQYDRPSKRVCRR